MHELSLAESAIQIIEEAARTQKFKRVQVIWLEVGSLAGVEPEALRFCFDAVAKGTVAQNARLQIINVPGSGACSDCGNEHSVSDVLDACPGCGAYAVRVTGGTAMRVKELEVV